LKAATEVSQLIFSVVQTGGMDSELYAWLNSAKLETHPFLLPHSLISAPAETTSLEPEGMLQFCADRLTAEGLRPIFIDQSRPDVLLKTVRAIVPGLRHIWARFAPGRLYDVPVRLGWLDTPLKEEELNSILCMI